MNREGHQERLLLFLLSSALLCFLIPIRKSIEEGHIFAGSVAILFGSFGAMGFIVALFGGFYSRNNINMTIDERETRLEKLEEELMRKRAQEKLLMERIEFLKRARDDDETADYIGRKEDFSQIK